MSTNILSFPVGEATYLVTFTHSPGTPDVRTLPNGDPGYPGDPPEFFVDAVTHRGIDITELLLQCSDSGDAIPQPFIERFQSYAMQKLREEEEAAQAEMEDRRDE